MKTVSAKAIQSFLGQAYDKMVENPHITYEDSPIHWEIAGKLDGIIAGSPLVAGLLADIPPHLAGHTLTAEDVSALREYLLLVQKLHSKDMETVYDAGASMTLYALQELRVITLDEHEDQRISRQPAEDA